MKLTTFFISRTKQIYATTLTISESTFKMKVMPLWTHFELLLMSAVICKQRLLHKSQIVQYLQNYKYQDINSRPFQKALTNLYNCPFIFHGSLNFQLLFKFKLLESSQCFGKINQTTFFRNCTLASQNRPKFTFLRQPSKK